MWADVVGCAGWPSARAVRRQTIDVPKAAGRRWIRGGSGTETNGKGGGRKAFGLSVFPPHVADNQLGVDELVSDSVLLGPEDAKTTVFFWRAKDQTTQKRLIELSACWDLSKPIPQNS